MINENYNKATDIYYLNAALSNFINNNIASFALAISNSKKLTFAEIEELNEHGLQSTTSPYVFISPSSQHIIHQSNNNTKIINITTLWFYRTNFAWFWTPTEPKSYVLSDLGDCNWSFIDPNFEIKAIGGKYDQKPPALRNINLISWLAGTGLRFII